MSFIFPIIPNNYITKWTGLPGWRHLMLRTGTAPGKLDDQVTLHPRGRLVGARFSRLWMSVAFSMTHASGPPWGKRCERDKHGPYSHGAIRSHSAGWSDGKHRNSGGDSRQS